MTSNYIVELEPGVWLTRGDGLACDPARTLVMENARQYSRWQDAKVGLTWARKYRPFKNAKIVELFEAEIGGDE